MLTGTKHFLVSDVMPQVSMTMAGEAMQLFTIDGSKVFTSRGQAAVIGFYREFRTESIHLEPVHVRAFMPSGKEVAFADLKAKLNNSSSGFLINNFQEVHPDFASLLHPGTPIFRMQQDIVERKMFFTREQFSVTEPEPKR